jgi:hypothetical protein
MLTPSGMRFVESLLKQSDGSRRRPAGLPAVERTPPTGGGPLPSWDRQRRELSIGRTVIKRYCVPAGNQEIILSAFQEEAWPAHIDEDGRFAIKGGFRILERDALDIQVRIFGGKSRRLLWGGKAAGEESK